MDKSRSDAHKTQHTATQPTVIDRRTLIPLTVAITLFVTSIAGVSGAIVWINKAFWRMETNFLSLQRDIADVKSDIQIVSQAQSNVMTRLEFRTWVELLKAANPELQIPPSPK